MGDWLRTGADSGRPQTAPRASAVRTPQKKGGTRAASLACGWWNILRHGTWHVDMVAWLVSMLAACHGACWHVLRVYAVHSAKGT